MLTKERLGRMEARIMEECALTAAEDDADELLALARRVVAPTEEDVVRVVRIFIDARCQSSPLHGRPVYRCPLWPWGRNRNAVVMDERGRLVVVTGRALRRLRP